MRLPEQMSYVEPILLWVAAYLIGSFSFGYWLLRFTGHGDIRTLGSKGIGATNALRIAGKTLAAGVLLGDLLKGAVPVYVVKSLWGEELAILAGSGIFIGHIFPVWLSFHGGKAIASLIGILLVLDWRMAAVFCFCWLVIAMISRYSSLASMLSVIALPLCSLFLQTTALFLPSVFATLLVFFAHRNNIRRLLRGDESRIGERLRT